MHNKKMKITKETAELLVEFAADVLYSKNDEWWHKLEWDKEYAKSELKYFLENKNIEIDDAVKGA